MMEAVFEVDPLTEFYDSIRSPLTKDRYEKRLEQFLRYMKADGDDKAKTRAFAAKAKQDPKWATLQINEFMRFQKARADRKQIGVNVTNF